MKLSVAIITYNEERNIARCLQSVKGLADQIIVVDSYSTDLTESICRQAGAQFVQHPFEGHIQQKNYALSLAEGEWILSLDADEALDDALRKSISKVLDSKDIDACSMNRLTNYCGHWVRHCGWYPDTKVRLVRRGKAVWTGVNPHDRLELKDSDRLLHIHGDILHYSYYTREDHLKQIEYFGDIASRELYNQGKRTNYALIAVKVIAQFIKSFVIKMGFLDGQTGFTISRLSAYATYRKHIKLLHLYHSK